MPLHSCLVLPSSHCLRIDLIILRVRSDEPDVDHTVWVVDLYDKAIPVPADIEHDPASLENARVSVMALDIGRVGPVCSTHLCVPVLQGALRVAVAPIALPEEPERTLRNDPHAGMVQ